MAKSVTIDNLGSEIEKILNEYEGEIQDNIDVITKRIGQKGAQALRNSSKAAFPKGSGEYAKGWTATVEKNRLYTAVTIHNKKLAGLAHLLEHGHVSSNGTGRNYNTDKAPVQGVEHIAPVEKELIVQYEKEVKACI